jgi:PAS domain S-box-containing protein
MKIPALPDNENERLAALSRYDILDTPTEPAFDALTRLAAHILNVPIALVSLVDNDRQWFKSRYGIEHKETSRDISFCGHVVSHDAPLVVEDASADERFADNPLVTDQPGIRFYAGFPLRTADGFVLGTLCAIDSRRRTPTQADLEQLELLALQTVDQLELRRQSRLLAEQELRLRAVLETATDAIITIDSEGQIEQVNPAVERLFGHRSEELVGRNVRLLMPAAMRQAHDRGMADYLLTGRKKVIGISRELLAMRKDGSTFPIDAMVSEMIVGERRLFTGILRDATSRKDAERKLTEMLADLRASRDDLLDVLNVVEIGVLVLAADRSVVFANDSFLLLCGSETEEILGHSWTDIMEVGESARHALSAMTRQPEVERHRLTVRMGKRKNQLRWVEIDVRDDPRDSERRIFFLYDVTDIHSLRDQLVQQKGEQMIGQSPAMLNLFDQIEQLAQGDWTVLLQGETGVGKELVARAIHAASTRHNGEFVAVNCAGLTDSLLGSQLFGHKRGAFTGAESDQLGVFEAAAGGTLLLDEIGDISPTVQAALLRVLQEKEITRLGETRVHKVDVRIIFSTNRNLLERVEGGHFREDLLYRIRGARIHVPPLRERREDIALLATAFLAQQRATSGKLVLDFDPQVIEQMIRYDWPGNIRELRSAVEHALVRCHGRHISLADLPSEVLEAAQPQPELSPDDDQRTRILNALRTTGGNRARAARVLGIGRATLYRQLKELGIQGKRTDVDPTE